ncbi:MAG: Crp/Fnr family transcriptional regulator [Ruminococcaceae bacterium]|nr:Crp/Fnr family transcriptional regulator [Oscillospiraceae bacterium]
MRQFRGCGLNYSDLFLFKGLENSQIEELHLNDVTHFKKGDIIYSDTVFNNAIGFIIEGSAVAVSNNHNETFLKTFTQNMCFGAAAVFGGDKNYVSTITAKSDCQILFITEKELQSIFEKFPQTAINYITFLSDKVRFLNNKLCVISCLSAEDTVLTYLSNVKDNDGYAQIPKNMTLFAKMLGLSRASLYRALDILMQNGSILKENNKYKVIKNEKTN